MALKELLSELEKEIQLKTIERNSYINQPQLITVSSDTTEVKSFNQNGDSYYTFTCSLERPAIGAKSLQLLSANIPQAKGTSFTDTELIFFYYRIKTQTNVANHTIYNETPNINNLYYVRLLPSYYPVNIIPNAQNYGFNKTFNNYQELSDELAKSCANDLQYTNINNPHFIPNDIVISYNEELNKFQMKGNNVNTIWDTQFPAWEPGVVFNVNQIVMSGSDYYISLSDNNIDNNPTASSDFWNLYATSTETSTKLWYTYLIAGYNDPNVLTLQQLLNEPLNGGNPDFFYGQYNLNNIAAIPSQPFKQGKTLAKRLGFSWNGYFTWDSGNTNLPLLYSQDFSSPLLWNRLRPIPDYQVLPPDIEATTIPIPNNNPFTSTTYIAENYCNLVYSSILNIYSDITTASSIDTQSKRNILSMIPINCGQLGITFTNNFIENALTKINNDIYQIRIELRDEIGEPYYISNNGIVSLTLKITY
jgi:hypothetical protein